MAHAGAYDRMPSAADIWSFQKVHTALSFCHEQDKQMTIKKWLGVSVFRFARPERDS